jgi:biopolymer transport protein ExbD
MRFTRRKSQRSDFEIVVTSMLDINFLLIMFFMLTAQFQRTTHARMNLPQEKGEKQVQVDEAGVVINVLASGDIVVSNQTVDMDALRVMVKEQLDKRSGQPAAALKLMIRADRDASTGHLNRVVSMLRELGVGTIRIATEAPIR